MTKLLDDGDIAAIQLHRQLDGPLIVRAEAPESADLVRGFLDLTQWRDLKYYALGVRARTGGDGETHGFDYLSNEAPCVCITVYKSDVHLSIAAFETLMLRFLRLAIETANKEKNDVLKEDWWPNVQAAANELERRVHSGPRG